MIYLGSERSITQDFLTHGSVAEDYSGNHKSNVKINGRGRVIRVVNKFKSHEDSINYNDFLKNQKNWYKNGVYHCISITGKSVQMTDEELGGNQVWIETYEGSTRLVFRLCHLDSVLVSAGEFVVKDTIIGYQGNTGLVLSGKSISDVTYGTHVHFEVIQDGKYINPRKYAVGEVITTFKDDSNGEDTNKDQIKILVYQINIRENPDENSRDLGDVYYDEYYNVLEIVSKEKYTWYKVQTVSGIIGYVASLNTGNWLSFIPKKSAIKPIKHIFTCDRTGKYLIYLYEGEKLYLEEK